MAEESLVERIETTRFVGSEFLLWLWCLTELYEGEYLRKDGVLAELWLDSRLTLQSPNDRHEHTTLAGLAPSGSKEAKFALTEGKLPAKAHVCVTLDTQAFSFAFDAASFSFSLVKLPEVLAEEDDARFSERMHLIGVLEAFWDELYQEFLTLRLSPQWEDEFVPPLVAWASGNKNALTPEDYRKLLKQAK